MDETAGYLWSFGAVGVLVALNAFFVATEFALVGVRKSKVEAMAREGVSGARTLLNATGELDRYIAGTQVGITLASLALGWIGEEALESFFHRFFSFLPHQVIDVGAPTVAAFMVITFLHVVLGELVPKSVALQYTEATALRVAAPITFTVWVLRPLIWALNSTGNIFLKALGLKPSDGAHGEMVHSVEELKILVEDSHRQGVLDEMERSLLHRVFKMKGLVARQVMVHRLDVVGIPVEMPYEGLMLAVVDAPYSRFPIYEGDLDHIVGVLFVKDMMGYRRTPNSEPFDLRKIVRPALFVPESVPIETLLAQFKKARTPIAIVLDEFGGTSGVVTLRDVVEELLGELEDLETTRDGAPPSNEDPLLQEVTVDGRMRLDVLNEKYGLALEADEVDTIAGFITSQLGRVPSVGEEVRIGRVHIRVQGTDGPRVTQVSLVAVPLAGDERASERHGDES